MKFHEKIAAVVAFVGILPVSAAETYTWIPGSTDWASEDSYVEDGKPGQGDIVLIPDGMVATNKVVASDTASLASFEAFSKLNTVWLESASSRIVLDIGAGLVLTNNCKILCKAGDRTGLIEKVGAGELEFGVNNNANAYLCNLTVKEGTLVLPQRETASQFNLGAVVVSNGATLVTSIDAAVSLSTGAGATMVGSLNGGGDITNRCVRARRLGFNVANTLSTFSGRIHPRVLLWPAYGTDTGNVRVNLTGTDSTTYEYGRGGGNGGTFKYLGEGEDATDKNFYVWTRGNSPVGIDGGNGGLKLTGTVSWNSAQAAESYGMQRLNLSGDGPLTNVFAGTMPTWKSSTATPTCFTSPPCGKRIPRAAVPVSRATPSM